MLGTGIRLSAAMWAFVYPVLSFAQAKPPVEFFVVCSSQTNLPSVYFSGVMQGPAADLPNFRDGFAGFLLQRYAYKGAVACAPGKDAAAAQNFVTLMATNIRNGKRNVVETGWTEPAATAVTPALNAATAKQLSAASAIATQGAAGQNGNATGSGGSGAGANAAAGAAQITSMLGSIFGTGGANAGGAKTAAGSSAASPGANGAGSGTTAGPSPFNQVSSALSTIFSNKSSGVSPASAGTAPKSGLPDGALGSAQSQTTQLIVFGCGRQDAQVACVNDVTNQNQKDTLIQASDIWNDAFIVDDRGDRHQRSKGFFLNIDGDQRQQLDIAYGKTARFVLMFDNVPTKVQTVALRSVAGALDVEGIPLIAAGATAR